MLLTFLQEIFEITFDGQKNSWHTAYVDLALKGDYGLFWEFKYDRDVEDNAGIDNVTIISAPCSQVTKSEYIYIVYSYVTQVLTCY